MNPRIKTLKRLLFKVLKECPPKSRIDFDPVKFPRKFYLLKRPKAEIEAVALFCAMLAYGSAKQFILKIEKTMHLCEWKFLDAISGSCKLDWPGYRFSSSNDIMLFLQAIGKVIKKHGGLEQPFNQEFLKDKDLRKAQAAVRNAILNQIREDNIPITTGLKYLLPDPLSGGCAKRWQMFCRWMVRPDDGVDLGIWKSISPKSLVIPLDRHISRIAKNLGMTNRASDSWKTALEITKFLAHFAPNDPVMFDFALCHLGISGECKHGKDTRPCCNCTLAQVCKASINKSGR